MTTDYSGPSTNRKRIRLDPRAYAQPGAICSITVAVKDRRPVFAEPTVAAAAADVLHEHAGKTGILVFGYCIMPDHVHLVLGPSSNCDLITFVGQYENLAQRSAWSQGVRGAFWQKSFWDHFLRVDEDVDRVVAYVLNNPVRRGLVGNWSEWPFAGSFILDL